MNRNESSANIRSTAALPHVARLMLACMTASQLSESVFRMAVAWWLLDVTHSPVMFGLLIAASNIAMTITHACLGWLADRFSRSKVIALAYTGDLCSCGLLTLMAGVGVHNPVLIGVLLVIGTIANTIAGPIHSSLAMQVSNGDALHEFIRHRTSLSSVAMIGGPIFAGILVSVLGARPVMVVHLGILLCILIVMMRLARRNIGAHVEVPVTLPNVGSRLRLIFSGVIALGRIKPEVSLCIQSFLVNMAVSPLFAVVLPVIVKEDLGAPAWALGLCGGAFGVGALVSSMFIAKKTVARFGRFHAVLGGRASMLIGFGGTSIFLFVSMTSHLHEVFAVLSLSFAGIGYSLVNIGVSQARAIATPEAYRNRLMSAASAVVTLSIPIGSASAGWMLVVWGPSVAFESVLGVLVTSTLILIVEPAAKHFLNMKDDALRLAYLRYLEPQQTDEHDALLTALNAKTTGR